MRRYSHGFTLIELSIVLVIIGLIVGGILVGQDLIRAASVRAQISQLEQVQVAVNTFRVKYNDLPGDLNDSTAGKFGFYPRPGGVGLGDGDGSIDSAGGGPGSIMWGETGMFWSDLTYANGRNVNLIPGNFRDAEAQFMGSPPDPTLLIEPVDYTKYFPAGKISGNFLYILSIAKANYLCLAAIAWQNVNESAAAPGLTPVDAYAIDVKVDNGLPQSGKTLALYVYENATAWASDTTNFTYDQMPPAATTQGTPPCMINSGGTWRYATTNSQTAACALAVKFQ
jgi:prepilin-type N-terminal cleavage/methylation domain-containing protein